MSNSLKLGSTLIKKNINELENILKLLQKNLGKGIQIILG
jgi:hypothetical protein